MFLISSVNAKNMIHKPIIFSSSFERYSKECQTLLRKEKNDRTKYQVRVVPQTTRQKRDRAVELAPVFGSIAAEGIAAKET